MSYHFLIPKHLLVPDVDLKLEPPKAEPWGSLPPRVRLGVINGRVEGIITVSIFAPSFFSSSVSWRGLGICVSSSWEVLHFGEVLKRPWWGPGERNVELLVYLFWGLYPLEKEGVFWKFLHFIIYLIRTESRWWWWRGRMYVWLSLMHFPFGILRSVIGAAFKARSEAGWDII